MTLHSIPRYDDDRVSVTGQRAVVLGGSVAGLVTARVLADAFEEVVVVERDRLVDESATRDGVPQGRHVHVLHEAARATLEDLFPGYCEGLVAAGALMIDLSTSFNSYQQGGFVADTPRQRTMYSASRPLFEQVARRRVAALDGVAIRDECQFTEYLLDERERAVEGVRVRDAGADPEAVDADLVVDATGRSSRTPRWLSEHGFPSPPTDEVEIDLVYSTAAFERPADERTAAFAPPEPPRTRGGGLFPVEDGRWQLTIAGVHGDHPPTTSAEFAEYARSLPVSQFGAVVDGHELLSEEIAQYPFPSTIRRRYEDLDRFPAGLLVVGDAIASFNPIYGQGMSVAALEALQLHHALAAGDREDLPARYFGRIERIVDDAWSLAVGADFAFPQTTGPRPRGTDLLGRYLDRLVRKTHSDGELADAYLRVIRMEERPSSLFHPAIAWRVLKPWG